MKKSVIIIFIFFSFNGYSQTLKSLKDSIKKYRVIDDKKALNFGFEALELNNVGEISRDLMDITSEVGEMLFYSKNYAKSIEYYNTSLKIHQLLPGSEKEHIYIPKNTIHRIENIGKDELIFIEIQLGENLKEEDIIRLEDDYGRI